MFRLITVYKMLIYDTKLDLCMSKEININLIWESEETESYYHYL